MALPTKTQISDAVENSSNILDPQLAGFCPISGIFGAEMYCGGFCIVYPLKNAQGKKYAFRVWHQEIDGIKDRIKKISDYLHQINIPYFVEFDFVENALRVPDAYNGDQQIDAIRMDWVSGDNLMKYLNSIIIGNLSDAEKKAKIQDLAAKFKEMVIILHEKRISHGDLQHGNIIVTPQQELKLVDYDSVYVPTFIDEVQVTSGLVGYQHPCRKGNNEIATEKDDYFSEYVIYTSLLAYAEDLSLWEVLDDEDHPRDEYSLLFKEADFQSPTQSALFTKLRQSQNQDITELVDILIRVLQEPNCKNLQPLETIFPAKQKYLEQSGAKAIDKSFLSQLVKENNRPTYTTPTINIEYDEEEKRKRYSQNYGITFKNTN